MRADVLKRLVRAATKGDVRAASHIDPLLSEASPKQAARLSLERARRKQQRLDAVLAETKRIGTQLQKAIPNNGNSRRSMQACIANRVALGMVVLSDDEGE